VRIGDEGGDHLGTSAGSYNAYPFGEFRTSRLARIGLGGNLFQALLRVSEVLSAKGHDVGE
jgi:hypothetical protein